VKRTAKRRRFVVLIDGPADGDELPTRRWPDVFMVLHGSRSVDYVKGTSVYDRIYDHTGPVLVARHLYYCREGKRCLTT